MVEINITLANKEISQFRILNEENKMHEHLTNCWNLANVVSNYPPNTYCRNCKDKGNMYIVGYGTFPNGEVGLYNLTNQKDILQYLPFISQSATRYYEENGFDESVNDMLEKKYMRHMNQWLIVLSLV